VYYININFHRAQAPCLQDKKQTLAGVTGLIKINSSTKA